MDASNKSEFALAGLIGDLLNVAYDDKHMTAWLARCAEELGCSSAGLFSWPTGDPDSHTHKLNFGNSELLSSDWCDWLDSIMKHYVPESPCLLEDLMIDLSNQSSSTMEDELQKIIASAPQLPANIKVSLISLRRVTAVLVFEHPKNSKWTVDDAEKIRFISHHVRNANQVLVHIYNCRWGASVSSAIMDSAPRGLTVLAQYGYIGYATSKAQMIIDLNDGITLEKGFLRFADKILEKEYYDQVTRLQAEEEGTHFMLVKRPSGNEPLQLMLACMRTKAGHTQTAQGKSFVVLFFHDPMDNLQLSIEALQRYFRFSKAEAKVAQAVFTQENMQAAADSLNLSINTVRTHLRRIYEKANISSQSELMRMLSSALRSELGGDSAIDIKPYLGNTGSLIKGSAFRRE